MPKTNFNEKSFEKLFLEVKKATGNFSKIDSETISRNPCFMKVFRMLVNKGMPDMGKLLNKTHATIAQYERSAIKKIHYSFRFADENNIYIGKRDGETLIPASGKFAIFEPAIDFGNSIPVYTTFQFTETPAWLQVPEERMNELNVAVFDIKLVDEMTKPRLSATIKNDSLFIIHQRSSIWLSNCR